MLFIYVGLPSLLPGLLKVITLPSLISDAVLHSPSTASITHHEKVSLPNIQLTHLRNAQWYSTSAYHFEKNKNAIRNHWSCLMYEAVWEMQTRYSFCGFGMVHTGRGEQPSNNFGPHVMSHNHLLLAMLGEGDGSLSQRARQKQGQAYLDWTTEK